MSNLENHNPQVIRQISKEVKNLSNETLEGIKISVNESNLTDIQAVIDGPGEQ
jgi:ubiquitin-conjugating enzyme E2 S